MYLIKDIKNYIDKSVLCWLATVSHKGIPNVSPKEFFDYYDPDCIIVANIASPQTVKNIEENSNVCLSFIDIFIQKGFQIKGNAEIISKSHLEFIEMKERLTKLTLGEFPFSTITKINIESVKPIIASKYLLYPETTEEAQIESAITRYGI